MAEPQRVEPERVEREEEEVSPQIDPAPEPEAVIEPDVSDRITPAQFHTTTDNGFRMISRIMTRLTRARQLLHHLRPC